MKLRHQLNLFFFLRKVKSYNGVLISWSARDKIHMAKFKDLYAGFLDFRERNLLKECLDNRQLVFRDSFSLYGRDQTEHSRYPVYNTAL